ncbi:hypothetical protein [Clostridium estertheticum]|uniref:hypothetical protein n=1 Tax=Clostridium estertheticum TaxID=238834 RepID=UPI001C0AAAC7|nr:hypothetical protein [Clostridium estertheticum]MBU3173275.1 hypothetical protein [Clostridium estertheticum]
MDNHYIRKMEILKNIEEGTKIVIIDPQNEYKALTKMVGENVVIINPLVCNEEEAVYIGTPKGGMSRAEIQLDSLDILNVQPGKCSHNLVFGKTGKGRHMTSFKEEDFKQELAPPNAVIKHFTVDGKKVVSMTY